MIRNFIAQFRPQIDTNLTSTDRWQFKWTNGLSPNRISVNFYRWTHHDGSCFAQLRTYLPFMAARWSGEQIGTPAVLTFAPFSMRILTSFSWPTRKKNLENQKWIKTFGTKGIFQVFRFVPCRTAEWRGVSLSLFLTFAKDEFFRKNEATFWWSFEYQQVKEKN